VQQEVPHVRSVEAGGLRSSVIGLGTWQFGSREWGYGEVYATETAPALVRRAVELGITMFDTAEAYGPGRSERIVGAALAGLHAPARERVLVATKFLPIAPAEPIVARQAAGSRRRLGVASIDLYYAHWPNPFVSVGRTMQALRPLVEAGLVRRVGVSNYRLEQWQAAERALRAPVVANQVRFSLTSPGPAVDLVPFAASAGRLVVAYSPLAQGLLADGAADTASGGRRLGIRTASALFRAGGRAAAAPLLASVAEVAATHGATPAQVALAWLIRHPNTIAIPGARTVGQLEENAAAADLELSDEEFARLSSAAAAFAGRLRA
jgi:aryl-alcohol dehydrogenase-like predicted oxidoreductase